MKKILIVEDNDMAAERLERIIKDVSCAIETARAASFEEARAFLVKEAFTLFIVDIILDTTDPNDASGLDFIMFLRRMKQYEFAPVIITTSLADPKLYAYDSLHCYQYLEKPFDGEKAREIIGKALQMPQRTDDDLCIHLRDEHTILAQKINEIIYLYYKDRKLVLKSVNGVSRFYYKSIAEVKRQLFSNDFVQCNRNTLLNRNYIWKVDNSNNKVILKDNYGEFAIGVTYRRKLYEEFING